MIYIVEFHLEIRAKSLWSRVSLVTWGTLQIWIRFVRQRSDPTLETNKQELSQSNNCASNALWFTNQKFEIFQIT